MIADHSCKPWNDRCRQSKYRGQHTRLRERVRDVLGWGPSPRGYPLTQQRARAHRVGKGAATLSSLGKKSQSILSSPHARAHPLYFLLCSDSKRKMPMADDGDCTPDSLETKLPILTSQSCRQVLMPGPQQARTDKDVHTNHEYTDKAK